MASVAGPCIRHGASVGSPSGRDAQTGCACAGSLSRPLARANLASVVTSVPSQADLRTVAR